MNVNSINSVAFTAKTKNGNEYNKTFAGLKTGLILGAIGTPLTGFVYGLKNGQKMDFISVANETATRAYKMSAKEASRILLKKEFLVFAAAVTGITTILGLLTDVIINKVRRNKADKQA